MSTDGGLFIMKSPAPSKYESGMSGQKEAEQFLQKKGYKIVQRNYRIKTGEIDIIASQNNYIIFIEVKFRRNLSHGYPREAVTYSKQQRIIKTALHYIGTSNLTSVDFRFDVIEVLGTTGNVHINHIENAFEC